MSMDVSALGQLATSGAEAPQDLGEQVEYLFAQQLLQAMNTHSSESEGEGYLGMLSDHLAREIAKTGGLGIGRQLQSEEKP